MAQSKLSTVVQRELVLLVLVPVAVCAALAAGIVAFWVARDIEDLQGRHIDSISAYLDDYIRTATSLLDHIVLSAERGGIHQTSRHLDNIIVSFPHFERLLFVDAQNVIVASAPSDFLGFTHPSRTLAPLDSLHYISKPLVSPRTGNLIVSIQREMPGGGTIAGELNLEKLHHFLTEVASQKDGEVILTDSFGNVIAHPQKTKVRQQANIGHQDIFTKAEASVGEAYYASDEEGRYLGISRKVPGTGWLLIVRQPVRAVAFPAAFTLLILLAVFFLLFLLVTGLLRIRLQRKVVQPLLAFTNNISIDSTSGYAMEPSQNTFSELTLMIKRFNTMTEQIEEREKALKASEKKYRTIFENALEGIYRSSVQGRFVYVNPAFAAMLGYDSPEDAVASITDISSELYVHPEDRQTILDALEKDGKVNGCEVQMRRKDGSIIWISFSTWAVREGNVLTHLEGIAEDVTQRKTNEQALLRLSQAVEQSPASVAIADVNGRLEYFNTRFLKSTGYTSEELLGSCLTNLGTGNIGNDDPYGSWQDMYGGIEWHGERQSVRKNGSTFWERVTISPIRNSSGDIVSYLTVSEDISDEVAGREEKAKLEGQLQHAQKMEALGTLAGGVAHDFNNLLQGLGGYIELLQYQKDPSDPELKYLEQMSGAISRAADLVGRLLVFGRKTEVRFEPVDLNDMVEETADMLGRTLPKMVRITTNLDPELPTIKADPNQIEQILLNLATNASDAMHAKGTLSIATQPVSISRSDGSFLKITPGNYALLTVTDDGAGMDSATLEKVFEPFFTTKSAGKGTGLGLSSVYGIVKNHHGHISCYSEPGVGTSFKIYLPVSDSGAAFELEQFEEQPTVPDQGNETILLVDDEESIRSIAREMLCHLGYKVIAAASGEEAISIFETDFSEIDLVVLDLGMPGIGGERCLEELKKINPRILVVITSGYSSHAIAEDPRAFGVTAFLSKPFRMQDLSSKVRAVLDQTQNP